MEEKKRPTGLTVFAIINFVFAGFALLSFILTPMLPETQKSLYSILSPLLTIILFIISGIGLLKQSKIAGYYCSNILIIGSILNIIIYNLLRSFSGFALHIPSLIYPIVFFLFLNFKYRFDFNS